MRKLILAIIKIVFGLLLAIALLVAAPVLAADRNVTVEWDAYTGAEATKVTKILIYQKLATDSAYDYGNPVAEVPQTVDADGNTTPSMVKFTITVPDDVITNYDVVARGENEFGQSLDSESVTWEANQTAMPAVEDFGGSYDKQTNVVNFTWTQTQVDRVKYWKLYQAAVSGGPFTEIDEIPWDGTSTELTASQSITPPAPGETVTQYYTVVAFAAGGTVPSPNSNEVVVTIDRRPATKVINLKVTVE